MKGRTAMLADRSIGVIAAALLSTAMLAPRAAASFVTFETGQVRPLALSPDRNTLLALNTPDARLEIFAVGNGTAAHVGSVSVGLEPVAVAARTNSEVWVVNHLSDSVSVVDIGAMPPRVVRTLLVGDEPRDVVFAGPTDIDGHFTRAFVTTARRGQNLPASVPPALTTPATPRALVYVFDTDDLGSGLGGSPLTIVELFGDTPRALAATPDGHTVYAAVFQSGDGTATVMESVVCNGGAGAGPCNVDGVQVPGGLPGAQVPGGLPPPNANGAGTPGPEVGLIVKHDPVSDLWEDQLARNWTNAVRFDLPDLDVFRIDALANPPIETAAFSHVGTVLFNMVVSPSDGALYVSNTEARNEVRFEGPGTAATTVRGHLHEARITVIDGNDVLPRHLNKHIDALPQGYRTTPMPTDVKEKSLATPLDVVLASDGTLYVAAFGSSTVGVFDAAELKADAFVPDGASHVAVSGGGPSGLALDEAHDRLYVLTRFDNAVKVIDTATGDEIGQHPLHNPEPPVVVGGRRFLYDARFTSSNGEAACASCHVFADFDGLAWDLGNPDGAVAPNPNPFGPAGVRHPFHPLKGPMTTQTLRGLVNQGPMHWRGDRTGGTFVGDALALDTELAFEAFNVAFGSLLGRDEGQLPSADMQSFTNFILQIAPPPNPVRGLDNQLTTAQANGRTLYLNSNAITDVATHCANCHTLDASKGQFGTGGLMTFANESQEFKVPQLKNAYQKIGMFGTPTTPFFNTLPADAQHQGDQIRGFGFLHDGSIGTLFDFLRASFFTLTDDQRTDLEQFMLAFDTTFAPIVGQQITLTSSNAAVAGPRIDLMIARATTAFVLAGQPGAKECDLIAKGVSAGEAHGYLFNAASGDFQSDRSGQPRLTDAQLRSLAATGGQQVTYTCAPPGEGMRLGLDRDGDGAFDRDELDAGTDPSDSASFPVTPTPHGSFTVSPTPSRTPAPPTATRTSTATRTPSASASPTRTSTASATPTVSRTPTATVPPTPTRTSTATTTPTASRTSSASATPSRTLTASATPTLSRTSTGTTPPTPTRTSTATATATASRTSSASATPSRTPSRTVTGSATTTVSAMPSGTSTANATPSSTGTSTETAPSTPPPTSTVTPIVPPTSTASAQPSPTATSTESASPNPTMSLTASARPTPTTTATASMPATPTTTSTATATPTHTAALPGDADCNGVLDQADANATSSALFNPGASAACAADCNQDGTVSAADLTCVVKLLPGSARLGLITQVGDNGPQGATLGGRGGLASLDWPKEKFTRRHGATERDDLLTAVRPLTNPITDEVAEASGTLSKPRILRGSVPPCEVFFCQIKASSSTRSMLLRQPIRELRRKRSRRIEPPRGEPFPALLPDAVAPRERR